MRIKNTDDLNRWFNHQSVETNATFAVRNALRLVPLLGAAYELSDKYPSQLNKLNLACFRCLAVAWYATAYPSEFHSLSKIAVDGATKIDDIKRSLLLDDTLPEIASRSAAFAAESLGNSPQDALNSAKVTSKDVLSIAQRADDNLHDLLWREIRNDISIVQRRISSPHLPIQALWMSNKSMPEFLSVRWQRLEDRLLEHNRGDWIIWTEWYKSRLRGGVRAPHLPSSVNQDIELAYVRVRDHTWSQGPRKVAEVINEKVNKVLDRFNSGDESGNTPDVTMREFIVHLLDKEAVPLSISEIVEEFDSAGFSSPRASIRGRLNSLTDDALIQRVARGTYASIYWQPDGPEQTQVAEDAPPNIPSQEQGLSFTISSEGKISFATTGLITEEDDAEQVAAMREVLGQAVEDLILATQGSNAFSGIGKVARRYQAALEGKISEVSVDMLYAQGIRLDNAQVRLKNEIERGELPDTGIVVGEALDSVLAIHGPTILSTNRGRQLLERSRQYNVSRDDELAYKERALAFSKVISNSRELVEPEVKETIEAVNSEIGEGRFPERSSDVARSVNQNFLSTIARVAIAGSSLVAGQAFLQSVPGADAISVGEHLYNSVYAFLQANSEQLRLFAAVAGQDLSWVIPFLDWWERQRTKLKFN